MPLGGRWFLLAPAVLVLAVVLLQQRGDEPGIHACDVLDDAVVTELVGPAGVDDEFEPERNEPGATGCNHGWSRRGITIFAVPDGQDIFERGRAVLHQIDDVSAKGYRAHWGAGAGFVSLFVLAGDQYAEVRFHGIDDADRRRLGAHAVDRLTGS